MEVFAVETKGIVCQSTRDYVFRSLDEPEDDQYEP